MKRTLYLLPFMLYTIFFALIILAGGGIESFAVPDVFLLLGLLLICGLGAISDRKIFNVIGIISLFILSFALIKTGIENNYFVLAEVKLVAALLIYYLSAFIISKDKFLIIMTGVVIGILLIVFVPIKSLHRDGGTKEYSAIAYKFIKWNMLKEDGSKYEGNNLYWFPNNFHSLEYYKPVQIPIINVSIGNQRISCTSSYFQWSKTVEDQNIMTTGDSFTNPVDVIYEDSLVITDKNIIKIDTSYNISNMEYANVNTASEKTEFVELNFNSEDKSIDLKEFENGTYIITFTINNNKDYVNYSFKVEVRRQK